jgi:hypothetical protein
MISQSGFGRLQFRGGDLRSYNPHNLVWERIKNGITPRNEPRIRAGDEPAKRGEVLRWRAPQIEIKPVQLPSDQIVRVPAGRYDCGTQMVYLERDFDMLPLTTRLLRHFSGHEAVAEIMERVDGYNSIVPVEGWKIAGYIGPFDARNIRDVFNPLLLGNDQLEIPSFASVAAFLSIPQNAERVKRVPYLLTQSPFVKKVIEEGSASNIAFRNRGIQENDVFVSCEVERNPEAKRYQVGRVETPVDFILNRGMVFEVRPKFT